VRGGAPAARRARLDDLHWADTATLLLLKYIARHPQTTRLMVVGTYRETDVAVDHGLASVLADLGREQLIERVALGRLEEAAVSELVSWHTGNRAPADLRRMVFEETDGNPFFVVEFSRHLIESTLADAATTAGSAAPAARRLPLPEGVKDLIRSRLSRLGTPTTRVLETASVIGQTFAFDTLERLSDLGQDELVDALDLAVRTQLIQESVACQGRYAFSHALIRDVLYATLTTTRRSLLHRRVAAAVKDARAADLDPHVAQLAYHLEQAGSPEDLERAVAYEVRAGEHALAMLAYEQTAAHYRRAVEMLERQSTPDRRAQRCDLTIAQGEAERMAGDPFHRQTLLRAAALAREVGDSERLARAALANNRGFNSSAQGVDHERVAVLEAALVALDDADSAVRAELLAQLGVELIADGDWRRRAQLVDDALEMARRVGDPATLARVLTQHSVGKLNPNTLSARVAHLREAWRLADSTEERLLASQAANFGFNTALEAGEFELAHEFLVRLHALAEQLGQPMIEWYAAVARATRCSVTGSPKEAERLAFPAYELGRRAGQPDALVFFLGHIYVARLLQGTLDRDDPDLAGLFGVPGSSPPVGPEFAPSRSIPLLFSSAMSAILCELGRFEDAREHFGLLMDELTDLPNDYSTLAILASASIACSHLGEAGRARQMHDLLAPHADRFVNTGATGASWMGAVRHHLACLCATMGRTADAVEHFAAAERVYERRSVTGWLVRCRLEWAALLLDRAEGRDTERALGLIARASATARELGMGAIEQRAAELALRADPARALEARD
jgi:tetratricopeptide (TPR) repeat protein